jgi:cytochrome c553
LKLIQGLAILAAVLPAVALAEGDPEAGRDKNSMCAGCHGLPGWRTAYPKVYHVPKLGGQHPQYFVNALKAYQSGDRNHPSMKGIAGSLTEKDMWDLATYYAQE